MSEAGEPRVYGKEAGAGEARLIPNYRGGIQHPLSLLTSVPQFPHLDPGHIPELDEEVCPVGFDEEFPQFQWLFLHCRGWALRSSGLTVVFQSKQIGGLPGGGGRVEGSGKARSRDLDPRGGSQRGQNKGQTQKRRAFPCGREMSWGQHRVTSQPWRGERGGCRHSAFRSGRRLLSDFFWCCHLGALCRVHGLTPLALLSLWETVSCSPG